MKMLWNTSFAPKYYTKNLYPWMVLVFLCISHTVRADNTGFIEVRADRIVLYPQRMELQGGETLKDVLEMYPELLVGDYSDVLNNYQLRMDNVNRYNVFNQDFYLQFNYSVGAFNLTVGDRIMLYHYGMNGYSGKWSNNTTRNMFQSSVIYRPCDKHQLQLGHYRKFVNPAYLDVFPEEWPNADGAIQAIDRCFCLWRVEGKQTIQQPLGRTTAMA